MGLVFGGSKPAPVATPDQALADRAKEEADAKQKAAEINAKAQGRSALINPINGKFGVLGSDEDQTQKKTLF